jgi:diguanylate cyclase (GGDEF)-like protein
MTWLHWPRIGLALLGLAVLIGLAYLLARLLTQPNARIAEEVAAVARGEPDVQPAVDPAAGRDLYQVATTLRTVSAELTGSRGELERTRGRLAAAERLTLIDPLTGVWNRRYLERAFREQVKRHTRFDSIFGVLVIDIDRFKRINDRHGHAIGDAVLTEVAHTIDGSVRGDIDVLARFGGEEFVVVLPETDRAGAVVAAEKIRTLIADSAFESDGSPVSVTVSIGVAACPEDGADESELLAAADAALYRAKASGRNRTVAAGATPVRPGNPGGA